MQTLHFSKAQTSQTILINQDHPYLELLYADLGDFEVDKDYSKYDFRIITKRKNGGSSDYLVNLNSYVGVNQRSNILNFNRAVVKEGDFGVTEVEFAIDNPEVFDSNFKLVVETGNYFVKMGNPWGEFEEELEENGNNRILFSAPFGQGKTTFLKKFFEKNQNKYEVFHLFPVNYAIANNEDIFSYIKAEIFYKLILKGVSFDKETIPHKIAFPFYLQKHFDKALLPLVRLFPKVGGDIYSIANDLIKLKENYLKEFEEVNQDNEKKVESFLDELHGKEGSLFEDNFYTQLIRKHIEELKTKKKSVLIIDDTDRMDPDHIFRILNVFAAHFDSPDYIEGDSNKFGFDKIVIVCDYENLHKIFSHKYGARTDFAGYIDKFFSKSIFRFDNSSAINAIINSMVPDEFKNRLPNFEFIVSDLIKTGNISLREVLKLKESQLARIADTVMRNGYSNTSLAHLYPTIHVLQRIFSSHILTEKLKSCQSNITEKNGATSKLSRYNSNSIDMLIPVIKSIYGYYLEPSKRYSFSLLNKKFEFEFESRISDTNIREAYRQVNANEFQKVDQSKLFDEKDFYELLLLVVNSYDKFQIENKILG